MKVTNKNKTGGFSEAEKAAMKQRAKEMAAEAKAGKTRAQGEQAVQEAIAGMSEPDRSMAKQIHALITKSAPELLPKTWYGMPAYAKDEKVVCFYKNADKFKERYATLGFNDSAQLDDGFMWPTSYALTKLTSAEEAKIVALVKKSVR